MPVVWILRATPLAGASIHRHATTDGRRPSTTRYSSGSVSRRRTTTGFDQRADAADRNLHDVARR